MSPFRGRSDALCTRLQVVQQTSGRGHQDVDAVGQLLGLGRPVASAHDEAVGVHVVGHQLLHHPVGLHGQLACGRQDDDAGACEGTKR